MNIKKKVLVIVIAFFAILGILFAVLIGVYYYMSYSMQQEIRESMSRSDSPNPDLTPHEYQLIDFQRQ
jgi:sensor domain CHASE-containing protein